MRTDRRVSILSAITDRLAGRAEVLHADGGDNEPVPPAARPAMFSPDEGRGQAGVLCEYFAGRGCDGEPTTSRQERALGKLVSHNMGAGQPAAYGAFRWSGWFWPERDGRHEFSLRGPGEMRMWLDDAPLIDERTPGQPDKLDVGGRLVARKGAALELAAGRGYPIRVEYVRAFASRDEQAEVGGGRRRAGAGST